MNDSPQAVRVHIGFFGRCNSGKSSLINALSGQRLALVSDVAGTTTDPVIKSMEINGIGACVLIDTAGFDDDGRLGEGRKEQTRRAADKTDVAVIVCGAEEDYALEKEWKEFFASRGVPVVVALNKADMLISPDRDAERIERQLGIKPVLVSATERKGIDRLIAAVAEFTRESGNPTSITGNLAKEGDVVVLVMPQDKQAPKGRLILPQVQTLRDLLDKRCIVSACTTELLPETLASLKAAPKLIITDSQVFDKVAAQVPEGTMLTSFSVLMACYKGDVKAFVEGAEAIDALRPTSRVLIAEACTHAPLTEDIGREKIPRMLRQRVGEGLRIDVVGGSDFPEDLTPYDLVIHCGACMFNRRHVLTRVAQAEAQKVPITNYGIAIAYLKSILDKVVYPDH